MKLSVSTHANMRTLMGRVVGRVAVCERSEALRLVGEFKPRLSLNRSTYPRLASTGIFDTA